VHLKVLPINALGKSMSTKGTKHFPTFYLHFTYILPTNINSAPTLVL
jgi:hypothetical protein